MPRWCAANRAKTPCSRRTKAKPEADPFLGAFLGRVPGAEKAKPPAGKVAGGHARTSQHRETEDGERLPAAGHMHISMELRQELVRCTLRRSRARYLVALGPVLGQSPTPRKLQINATGQLRKFVRAIRDKSRSAAQKQWPGCGLPLMVRRNELDLKRRTRSHELEATSWHSSTPKTRILPWPRPNP